MATLDDLRAKEREFSAKLQAVQAEIMADNGGLDLVVYRQRLKEAGLLEQWDQLQAEIRRLQPQPEKSVNQQRKEAGLVYVRRRRPTDP